MRGVSDPLAEGALFTDHYQLTMAQLYLRAGLHERTARFEYFFRSYPDYGSHQAGYCVFAGLASLMEWMLRARFSEGELDALRRLKTGAGGGLFSEGFLAWLGGRRLDEELSIEAVPEGRVVHPGVPLAVVEGPLAAAQLLETALLNHLNFETLIATKASRIRQACLGRPVVDFGLRRAHGKGGNAGSRAALIGGADATSNVGAAVLLGLPSRGTHAHSMVQAVLALGGTELDAFRLFAEAYPGDCVLLVDTVDTLESGVPNAIKVFEELRARGRRPGGIRLDSGDLAYLAIQAYRRLSLAGFGDVSVVLSNQIDELVALQILRQIREEAPGYGVDPARLIQRLAFGVGTRLITSEGHPALDGVYKLVAVKDAGVWRPAMKTSDSPAKALTPGAKRAWRLYDGRRKAVADLLTLEEEDPRGQDPVVLRHPADPTVRRVLPRASLGSIEPLLRPFKPAEGDPASLEELRRRREADLERLDPGVKRIINPHVYHVSLSERLFRLGEEFRRGRSAGALPARRR